MAHNQETIKLIDPWLILMEDVIGHVRVQLFKRNGSYAYGTDAFMSRKLNDQEARFLLALWNSLENFLRAFRPQSQTEENK